MKIALLTTHWANNYGASLQTFATVKALQKYADVTLLDYRTPYAAKGMQLIRVGRKPRDLLRVGKDVFRLVPRYKVISKFKEFTQQLSMTEQLKTDKDFEDCSTAFDLFVVGSDQVWNPFIVSESGQLDTRFMLDFVKDKPKISYASSLGSAVYPNKQKQIAAKLLSEFDALSVREKDSANYLNSFLSSKSGDVISVVDPTLLHSKQQWLDFLDLPMEQSGEKFILVYALKKDELLKNTVNFYKEQLGYKVVTIDQDPFINYKTDKHIKDASPKEFIGLFRDSSFVITNSFHGTCFSVNFNKNFIVTTPPTSSNRISSLLSSVDLPNRFLNSEKDLRNIDVNVDFTESNKLLENIRNESLLFLDEVINAAS